MSRRSIMCLLAALVTLLSVIGTSVSPATIDLIWHWEGAGSNGSREPDSAINPASVVKLATTLWALETLGPEHRFRTTFLARGDIDAESGVLRGDLYVIGGGDPDFHVENAQLVARSLFDSGVRRVEGALYVDDAFWIGWENGSEGVIPDREQRARKMAQRLADAWNPRTWRPPALRAMRELRESKPEIEFLNLPVARVAGLGRAEDSASPLVEHVSNPLVTTLKRFNDFSNNDIERLGYHLGDARRMSAYFRQRWGDPQPSIRFQTLSGLGANRMSPRQITRLVRELSETLAAHDLALAEVLPALGCGRNTLQNYRGLLEGIQPAGLVGKTGTLVQTDGGVITLAGSIDTDRGSVVFFVGAPRNGARMSAARRAQTRWLLERTAGWTIRGTDCVPGPVHAYHDAAAVVVGRGSE